MKRQRILLHIFAWLGGIVAVALFAYGVIIMTMLFILQAVSMPLFLLGAGV